MIKDVFDHWKNVLVNINTSILSAIKRMDAEALRVLLVVNDSQQLLGIITDGDIRRYFLKQASLEANVSDIMGKHPVTASPSDTREQLLIKMQSLGILHIPIVDNEQRVVGLETLENLVTKKTKETWVVLMAGGLGSRLKPLTDHCPKSLLKIGSKPVLEIVLENFIEYGFHQFYFAINYKGHLIKEFNVYSQAEEVSLKLYDGEDVLKKIEKYYRAKKPKKIDYFDGLTLEFDDYWFSVRKSNTEPLLRINLEAIDKKIMKEKLKEVLNLIKR